MPSRDAPIPFPARTAGPDDGPLVILLHGFPETKEAWSRVLPLLGAEGCRAVAFDQRGYRPPAEGEDGGPYTLDVLAGDVLAVADALDVDRFHVVGHDWGGMVGWHLAAHAADRLHSLTVVATPHPRAFVRSLLGTQLLRSLYLPAFSVPVLPELALTAGDGALLKVLLHRSGLGDDDTDRFTAAMVRDGTLGRALGWYRSNGLGAARRIGPSRVPTLYVWPAGDVALGRAAAERTGDHVHAPYRFVVLDGASHWVPEQRPAVLARLVVEQIDPARQGAAAAAANTPSGS